MAGQKEERAGGGTGRIGDATLVRGVGHAVPDARNAVKRASFGPSALYTRPAKSYAKRLTSPEPSLQSP